MSKWKSVFIPRDVLLVEIERRCPDARCNARTRIGLTKEEARAYCGFECESCERSWDDDLTERDVPEWWEELKITGLDTVREKRSSEPDEPSEVVTRMSESFQRGQGARHETGEDSF
jgi:hypothetical protein